MIRRGVEVKLDGRGGISGFEGLVDELIGNGVEVVLERDVVIDVDSNGFPVSELVALLG